MTDRENAPVVRQVVLELLRPGPPHNQLLSPLTPYLALCSSHSAEVVNVPFEHWELLRRLRDLEYRPGDRLGAIQELAKTMGEIIGRVAGLGTELMSNGDRSPSFVQLRLVISASELALLPWELAMAPKGFPGEGTPLVLQTLSPLTLTREVRRPPGLSHPWPREARILFAAAAPGGLQVPLEEHLLALRRAIAPWVKAYDTGDSKAMRNALDPHLTVLPTASLYDIRRACAKNHFTHVHLLAHGRAVGEEDRRRYGLALHDLHDPERIDVVEGERLVSALIGQPHQGDGAPRRPTMVTIASCQGGDIGSVAFPGGSLAHDLHRAGIPLVVASQFPLTVAGSIVMAEVLYKKLLWGEDPRLVLRDLRVQLHALHPESHDWASLVAYDRLPLDLQTQLAECRYVRSLEALRLLLKCSDDALTHPVGDREIQHAPAREPLELALDRIPEIKGREAEAFCHRGAQHKRWAQILWHQESGTAEVSEQLEKAWIKYRQGFTCTEYQHLKDIHWSGTQFLCLSFVLEKPISGSHWNLLVGICERETEAPETQRQAWAFASLIELYLLASFAEAGLDSRTTGTSEPMSYVVLNVAELHRRTRDDLFALAATLRQIERYVKWWLKGRSGLVENAAAVLELLKRPELARKEAQDAACRIRAESNPTSELAEGSSSANVSDSG